MNEVSTMPVMRHSRRAALSAMIAAAAAVIPAGRVAAQAQTQAQTPQTAPVRTVLEPEIVVRHDSSPYVPTPQ